jgi:hypothetical protein
VLSNPFELYGGAVFPLEFRAGKTNETISARQDAEKVIFNVVLAQQVQLLRAAARPLLRECGVAS